MQRHELYLKSRRVKSKAASSDRTSILEQRKLLSARVNKFQDQALIFIGREGSNDHEPLPNLFATVTNGKTLDNFDEEVEEDADEDSEHPEHIRLNLPSAFSSHDREKLGLREIAIQEGKLREGQANDCLSQIRILLGNKFLLFRKQVRNARSNFKKTRAWGNVTKIQEQINKVLRSYNRARHALVNLDADPTIISLYAPITTDDLKMPGDIVEENRVGQHNDKLPWFWRIGARSNDSEGSAMTECMYINLIL